MNTNNCQQNNTQIPSNIKSFNWGSFVMWNWWGLWNGRPQLFFLYIAIIGIGPLLLCTEVAGLMFFGACFDWFISPIILFVMSIYYGINGNKIAWKNKKWESIEKFENSSKKWNIAGLVIFGLIFFILSLYVMTSI